MNARAAGAAVLLGAAWGAFCWWGDGHEWVLVRGVANTAGPWLLLAFWAGAQSTQWTRGAALGVLALVAAVAAYYLAIEVLDAEQAPSRISLRAGLSWATVAVPVGLASGAGGALWRGRGWAPTIAVGLLAAALFGEALLLLSENRGAGVEYLLVPVSAVTLAFVLPPALLDRREAIRAVVVAGAAGPLALATQEAVIRLVRDSLR